MSEVIHILWSGGWDSTFRILQAIILEQKKVQPYYLFDHRRNSYTYEIQAIKNVYRGLRAEFPAGAALLQPMIIYNKSKLKRYKDMRRISQSLSNTFALGIQYEWFARFARQYNHKEIEVGFIRHEDNSDGVFTELIRVLARGEGHTCSIPENSKYPFISMFTSFRFPTLHLTKVEMGDLARKNGFHHLLALSWYCFNPGREGQRCGVCNPCKTAFLSGNVYSFLPEVHVPTEKYSLNRWFTNKILDV